MTILKSNIKPDSSEFLFNKKKLDLDLKLILKAVDQALDGGGKKTKRSAKKTGENVTQRESFKTVGPWKFLFRNWLNRGF